IRHQIAEYLKKQLRVAHHLQRFLAEPLQDLGSGRYLAVQLADLAQEYGDVDLLRMEVEAGTAVEQARRIQEIVYQMRYPQNRPANSAGALVDFLGRHALFQLDQTLSVTIDDRQRRTEFV